MADFEGIVLAASFCHLLDLIVMVRRLSMSHVVAAARGSSQSPRCHPKED